MMRTKTHRHPSLGLSSLPAFLTTLALLASPTLAQPTSGAYGNPAGSNYSNSYDNYDDYEDGTSYSYARVLEGSATLLEVGGDRDALQVNQPLLVGDRVWVSRGSRVELSLSDRSLLRIDGDSEVLFDALAYSADSRDRETALRVIDGEIQLVVPRDALGEALPRIETPAATLYIHSHGTYRIAVHRRTAELTVREGLAELVGDQGSVLLHPGEMGWATEGRGGRIERASAGYRSSLERWGDELSRIALAGYDQVPYVDDSLRYAAAPLARHGSWVSLGSSHAWRPTVAVEWRPYHRGYWRSTPVGPTWVSSDPWGYVTHHYGSWDYHDHHGWLWYPGRVYSPARVTWYWGPSYVGWCPTGYYERYYRRHNSGFNLSIGVYGTAGGHWGHFSHWSFTATVHFGRRHHHHNVYSGPQLAYRHDRLEHGIITGHRGYGYRGGASATYAHLRQTADRNPGHTMHDVTDFVGRKPLRTDVASVINRPTVPTRTATTPTLATRPAVRGDRPSTRPVPDGSRGNTAATRPGQIATTDKPAAAGRPGAIRGDADGRLATRPGVTNSEDARGVGRPSTIRDGDRGEARGDARGTLGRGEPTAATRPGRGERPSTIRGGDRGDARGTLGRGESTLGRGESTPSTRPGRGRGDRGSWYSTDPSTRGERPSAVTPPRAGERPRTVTPPRSGSERPRATTPPRSGSERPRATTPPRAGERPRTVTPPRSGSERPRATTPPRSGSERPRATTPPRSGERPRTVPPPRSGSERPRATTPPRSGYERPRATTPPRSAPRPRATTPPRSNPTPRATTPPRSAPRPRATTPPRSNPAPRATTPPRSNQRPRADRPSNNRSNSREGARQNNRRRDDRRDNG